ncbi:MAG: helix-turn-helix domain-containing protein [Pyrinomonadaceae bacterium]
MTRTRLVKFRKHSKQTQIQAARALGVSQTYLSLLEKGKRPLTDELRAKAVRAFHLPPTEVPLRNLADVSVVSDAQLASDLATLGYPGFSYLKKSRPKNPAVVLLSALRADNREVRDVEALPWVVLTFPDMDWPELIKAAKVHDLQNRLGFVTNVARQMAELRNDTATAAKLSSLESELEPSKLVREGTLCNDRMTNAERKWLATNRPKTAKHWRLLTDLSPRSLDHYD